MKPEDWIEEFAQALGARAPDAGTVEGLLELAATAAHASERTAAPIACYLAGLTGAPLSEVKAIAEGIGGPKA